MAALSYFWSIRSSNRIRDTGDRCGTRPNLDLVASILWSRLGALPDPSLTMPDGSPPTQERIQVAWALDHAKKNRVFRFACLSQLFEADAAVGAERGARSLYRQWDSCRSFSRVGKEIARQASPGACSEYRDLQEFEEPFRSLP